MSRNGSGTMSIPNTLVSGTTITAAAHNQNYADIVSEITNSVAADGQTTMTGPLKASSGTAAAPSHTFGSDTDTGGYRSGANEYSVAAGGVQITKVSSAGLDIKTGGLLVNGVAIAAASDGAALSVLGVTGNASANRADIAAASDGHVLRRNGTAIGFGTVATAGIADAAVTLAKQADLASGAFIVRYTASTGVPQAGSFGSTLSLNTSTGALNVAVPAAMTFISSVTASSQSAISFTSGIDSTYREYVFLFDSVLPATDNVQLICEVSDDAGSTWKSTSYLAFSSMLTSGGTGNVAAGGASTSNISLSGTNGAGNGLSNTAGAGWSGEVRMHNPSSTSVKKQIRIVSGSYIHTGGTVSSTGIIGGGFWNGGDGALTGIRFRFSSGNVASGSIYMYGIKGS